MTYEMRHSDTDASSASSSPIATVNKYGQLSSGSEQGVTSVVITSLEDYGVNQTVVIAIKVTLFYFDTHSRALPYRHF